jgi:hypothetical protein
LLVAEQPEVARDEVVGEGVPGVDRHLEHRRLGEPEGEFVAQCESPVAGGHQEENAVGFGDLGSQPDPSLDEDGGLACPRTAQDEQGPAVVIDDASLAGVQDQHVALHLSITSSERGRTGRPGGPIDIDNRSQ